MQRPGSANGHAQLCRTLVQCAAGFMSGKVGQKPGVQATGSDCGLVWVVGVCLLVLILFVNAALCVWLDQAIR